MSKRGFSLFLFCFPLSVCYHLAASVNPSFLGCSSMAGLFLPASENYQMPLLLLIPKPLVNSLTCHTK
ncbi:hypothetical protein ACB098_02G145400 [Castanea mollissima]